MELDGATISTPEVSLLSNSLLSLVSDCTEEDILPSKEPLSKLLMISTPPSSSPSAVVSTTSGQMTQEETPSYSIKGTPHFVHFVLVIW